MVVKAEDNYEIVDCAEAKPIVVLLLWRYFIFI